MISRATPAFISKCESKYDRQGLFFRHYVELMPGYARLEVTKEFYEEACTRMRSGVSMQVELVLK